MPSTNIIWHQSDRDTAPERARRELHKAQGALENMWSMVENSLDPLRAEGAPAMFGRVIKHLSSAISATEALVQAYEYSLARCLEAGFSSEAAATAWDIHSDDAFEAEMIAAESYGPNAMRMIDTRILRVLGIALHDQAPEDEGSAKDTPM